MTSNNHRTSMYNLTRPTASVNDYVTLQRYKNHLWYLKSIYRKMRKLGVARDFLSCVLFEMKWCYEAQNTIATIIECNENGAFAFGLPVVTSYTS